MGSILRLIFYDPLVALLVFLYQTVAFQDLGVAIILLTILVRLVLYPLFYQSFRHQALLQQLEPEIRNIQNHHRHDREKQAQALLTLYRKHKVNPLTSLLLILIQLPVLIALYYVFLAPPPTLSTTWLNLIDLSKPSIIMVVAAAAAQYVQGRWAVPPPKPDGNNETAARVAQQMVYLGPLLTLFIFWRFPAAVSLYWVTSSLFSFLQQFYVRKKIRAQPLS